MEGFIYRINHFVSDNCETNPYSLETFLKRFNFFTLAIVCVSGSFCHFLGNTERRQAVRVLPWSICQHPGFFFCFVFFPHEDSTPLQSIWMLTFLGSVMNLRVFISIITFFFTVCIEIMIGAQVGL